MTHESAITKPKLDRKNLEKQGIFYLEQQLFSSCDSLSAKYISESSEKIFDSIREYLSYGPRGYSLLGGYGWGIPAHVDWLRELLLDFNFVIPAYAKDALLPKERRELPPQIFFEDEAQVVLTSAEQEEQKNKIIKMFGNCRDISKRARCNQDNCVTEFEWQRFMQRYIFEPYCEQGGVADDKYVMICSTLIPLTFKFQFLQGSFI